MYTRIASVVWLVLVLAAPCVGGEPGEVKGEPAKQQPAKRAASAELCQILEDMIDTRDFQQPMTLKEALGLLQEKIAKKYKRQEPMFLVNVRAFKEENPEAQSIYDTPVKFPAAPAKTRVLTLLRVTLGQVQPPTAT